MVTLLYVDCVKMSSSLFKDGSRRSHHISRSGTAGGLPHTQPTGLPSSGTGSLADPGCLSRIRIFFHSGFNKKDEEKTFKISTEKISIIDIEFQFFNPKNCYYALRNLGSIVIRKKTYPGCKGQNSTDPGSRNLIHNSE
jgi:hypothetical protein